MRIAIYYNLTPGGAERALFEFSKRLALKHRLDFYTLDIKTKKKSLLLRKVPGRHFYFKTDLPRNFLLLQFYIFTKLFKLHKQIAEEMEKKKYDIVLATHDYLTKSPLLLRYLNIPTVYLCHEPFREFYEPPAIFSRSLKYKIVNLLRYPLKWIDEVNVKEATVVVANSRYSQERLTRVYKRQVDRIRLGVDREYFKMKHLARKEFFLTVGPLAVFKGIDFLIKAISLLPKNKKLPLVVVANGGRDERYIRRLASSLRVGLRVKSKVSDQDLIDLYNKAKLFLYAPYYEPFGLVVLEAMACGLPVVGVKEGGLKDILIENKNGWLSDRDPKKFSLTIKKALEKTNQKFRKITRQSVKQWDWNESVLMLEKILRKASRKGTING